MSAMPRWYAIGPLLLLLSASCTEETAPTREREVRPLPPMMFQDAPEGFAAAVASDATALVAASSIRAVARDFDWLVTLLDGRPIEELLGNAPDPAYPVALAFHPQGRHAVARYENGYAGAGERAAGDSALAKQLLRGAVTARADLTAWIDLEQVPVPALRKPAAALREGRLVLDRHPTREDIAVLDLAATVAPNSILDAGPEPASSPLPALLRAMPRAYPLTLATDWNYGHVLNAAGPLAMLALGRPGPTPGPVADLALLTYLDRGLAAGLDVTGTGVELVVLARTSKPDELPAAFAGFVERKLGPVERRPSTSVGGIEIHDVSVRISTRDPDARLKQGGYLSFRTTPGDAKAARRDAAVLRKRLRLSEPRAIEIVAEPGFLFARASRSVLYGDAKKAESRVEQAMVHRGLVSFRRVVRPSEAARGRLLAARTTNAPVQTEDGVWYRCAASAPIAKDWRAHGFVLTRSDPEELTNGDVGWAWASMARLGPRAPTRDVSFRWKPGALDRWRAFAARKGEPAFAVLLDDRVISVSSYVTPVAAEADILDVDRHGAEEIAAVLAAPPLASVYESDGRRPIDFVQAAEIDARFARALGGPAVRVRYGLVGDTLFVAAGEAAQHAELIARALEAGTRAAPGPFGPLLQRGGRAVGFLAHIDVDRLVEAGRRLLERYAQTAFDTSEWPTRGVHPIEALGWHVGTELRARIVFDVRLARSLAVRTERQRPVRTRSMARALHRRVVSWRVSANYSKIPARKDLPNVRWEDAWNRVMRIEDAGGGRKVIVRSAGADGRFGTDDDVVARRS